MEKNPVNMTLGLFSIFIAPIIAIAETDNIYVKVLLIVCYMAFTTEYFSRMWRKMKNKKSFVK